MERARARAIDATRLDPSLQLPETIGAPLRTAAGGRGGPPLEGLQGFGIEIECLRVRSRGIVEAAQMPSDVGPVLVAQGRRVESDRLGEVLGGELGIVVEGEHSEIVEERGARVVRKSELETVAEHLGREITTGRICATMQTRQSSTEARLARVPDQFSFDAPDQSSAVSLE